MMLGKEMQGYLSCVDATIVREGSMRVVVPEGFSTGY